MFELLKKTDNQVFVFGGRGGIYSYGYLPLIQTSFTSSPWDLKFMRFHCNMLVSYTLSLFLASGDIVVC